MVLLASSEHFSDHFSKCTFWTSACLEASSRLVPLGVASMFSGQIAHLCCCWLPELIVESWKKKTPRLRKASFCLACRCCLCMNHSFVAMMSCSVASHGHCEKSRSSPLDLCTAIPNCRAHPTTPSIRNRRQLQKSAVEQGLLP